MATGSETERPWISRAARAGYTAKGVVYGLVGVLALQAAWFGGHARGTKGVLVEIASRRFGTLAVIAVVLGLACYSVWRFVQAVLDVDGKGRGPKALVVRAGIGVSSLAYASLAIWGARFLLGTVHAGDDAGSKTELTARVLALPFGPAFVATAGGALLAVGLFQGKRALQRRFLRRYEREMGPRLRVTATVVGAFGVLTRALTFLVMGGFALHAALTYDPEQTKGLRQALTVLARQPYGSWVLGLVAAGFVAYGLHCFLAARYREIPDAGGAATPPT